MRAMWVAYLLVSTAAFGQYKLEPVGALPPGLAPEIAAELQPAGHKIVAGDGKVYCEIWFRAKEVVGPKTSENDVTWVTTPPGALIGAIRFPGAGGDRRGQAIKPGVYTLRFGMQPVNGDHQGVAPQRDFLVFSPADEDKSAAPVSDIDDLVNMSRKVSGTPHPAVLSMWKVDSGFAAGFSKMGEQDWVLQIKVGEAAIAVILIGKVEG